MGRFDALTNLDEKQQELKPPTTPSPIPSSQKEQNKEVKRPANPQAGKTANPLTRKPASGLIELDTLEKPEKYTTRLIPSLVKKVRLFAIDKDMKDYEVVSTALNEYLERNK
jgi:hypothetical protein